MNNILSTIVFANGIYDILCAISICLRPIVRIPVLDELHLSLFKRRPNPYHIALWIFVNGIVRCSQEIPLIALSYYIEAVLFAVEWMKNNVVVEKTVFVIASSVVLGYLVERM